MDLDEPAPIATGTALPNAHGRTLGRSGVSSNYYIKNDGDWGSLYTISGNVTIDLNGKTFWRQDNDGYAADVLFNITGPGNSLTIVDNSAEKNGTITYTKDAGKPLNSGRMFDVTDGGKLTIKGGTFSNSNGGIIYANGSTVDISGGTLDGQIVSGSKSWQSNASNVYLDGAELKLSGGTIERSGASGIEAYNGSKIEMSGGTITSNDNSNGLDNSKEYGGGISLNGGEKGTSGKGSTLTMTGGAISNNTANEAGGGVSVSGAGNCTPPCSFTFENGTIENNSTNVDSDDGDHGGGIFVGHNGSFTMSGGTVSGNHARWGGGICIGSYTISGSGINQNHKRGCTGDISITGGTIENNTATSTSYKYWSGTGGGGINIGFSSPSSDNPIKIGGNDLQITGNTGQDYGGGIAIFESDVELTGGTISGNQTTHGRNDYADGKAGTHDGGGGLFVYVADSGSSEHGSTFTMSGGTITNNTSKSGGGGIYVDGVEQRTGDKENKPNKAFSSYGIFNMTGGTVSKNTASEAEGGGIRIRWAKAYIGPANESDPATASTLAAESAQIQITDNQTTTTQDWGGGGIFCEEGGYLFVKDALITANRADGFGGGVAACSTGDDDFTYQQATAIFGNAAKGENLSGIESTKPKDHVLKDGNYIPAGDGQDYFNANLCDVADIMLGGGDPRWSGTYGDPTGKVDGEGNATYTPKTLTQLPYGSILEAKGYAALNSNPSDYDKQVAESSAKVLISGNSSTTHGGGILNNGTMFLGAANGNAIFAPEIQKKITGTPTGGTNPEATFTFNIESGTYADGTFTPDEDGYSDAATITVNADGTMTNDGIVRFDPITYEYEKVSEEIGEDATYPYYYLITETKGDSTSYTYDTNQWLLTVNVKPVENLSLNAIGSGTGESSVVTNALSIESYSYQKLSSSGATIGDKVTGVDALATFTNAIYMPPTPPSTPRTGSLILHKVIVGGPAEAQSMAFTFHVTGPSGYSKDVTVIGSGTATLNGLKAGDYQVAEVGGAIDGYTLTATVTDDGAFTIKANTTAEMTVTNTYEEGAEDGPVDPDDPSFPVEPGDPNNPNNPNNPSNPSNPNDPTQAASGKRPTIMPASNPKMLPQTGDATPTGLIPVIALAGIVALAIGIHLLRRRKPLHLR